MALLRTSTIFRSLASRIANLNQIWQIANNIHKKLWPGHKIWFGIPDLLANVKIEILSFCQPLQMFLKFQWCASFDPRSSNNFDHNWYLKWTLNFGLIVNTAAIVEAASRGGLKMGKVSDGAKATPTGLIFKLGDQIQGIITWEAIAHWRKDSFEVVERPHESLRKEF